MRNFTAPGTCSNGSCSYASITAACSSGCQDGVCVNAGTATAGTVNDGVADDIDLQSSTTELTANWTGYAFSNGALLRYEWAIGTTADGTDIQPFTAVSSGTTATRAGLLLTHDTRYFVSVRAHSNLGLTATASSDGVRVDATSPVAGTVNDGSAADISFQTSINTLSANWTGFSDPESSVVRYEWAIGTTSGGTDVQLFTDVGTTTTATASGLSLAPSSTYFISVRATNGAGASTIVVSNGVWIETSAPVAGTVSDGAGADVDLQQSATQLQANWTGFSDPESGIAKYEWAIGTSPGGTSIQAFTDVGTATTATATGLALNPGVRYHVTVRATNGASQTSTASSDGVIPDPSPPVVGTVNDGTAGDIDFQASASTINANWSGFTDAQSGIAGYEWAIGTSAGGVDVQPFTSVGTQQNAAASGLTLANGVTYYVTVRATNGVGTSSTATSDGVSIDSTPPQAGTIADGSGPDIDFQTSATTLQANWSGFADPETGITLYEVAAGTTPGGTDLFNFFPAGTNTTFSAVTNTMTSGTRYYVTVRATNGIGVTTLASSDGFTVDTSGPTGGFVYEGPVGGDLDYLPTTTTVDAHWSSFADPHSGIVKYEWAIGTAFGGSQVMPFTDVGLATSGTVTGLSLTAGTQYTVSVRATNGAGMTAVRTSDGFRPDPSPPVAGIVRDGLTAADAVAQTSTTSVAANWSGFGDPESGIVLYFVAFGTTPGGEEIRPFSALPSSATSDVVNGLGPFPHGTMVYAAVRAQSGSGATVTVMSNGVIVDTTPPVAGTVNDGPGADVDVHPGASGLVTVNWSGFSDPESDIVLYQWAVGSTPGAADLKPYANNGTNTSATWNTFLSKGQKYYFTVRAYNSLSQTVTASSDGFEPGCAISGVEHVWGAVNSADACLSCEADKSGSGWSVRPGGTAGSCTAQGKNCGLMADGCGGTLSCGECAAGTVCGGGGTANVCACKPKDCTELRKNCGSVNDGCGGTLSCGTCATGDICGGANVCGKAENVYIYGAYGGGTFTLNIDVNVPNIAIGLTSRDGANVSLTGPYVSNVVAVRYAGQNTFGTTVTGVPAPIVTVETLPPVTLNEPYAPSTIVCGGEAGAMYNFGCNTKSQIQDFFLSKFGGQIALHRCAVSSYWSGTINLSAAGACNCSPISSCSTIGKNCGMAPDGCGGTINCGSCGASQTCGAFGIPNLCGGCPTGTQFAAATPTTFQNEASIGVAAWSFLSDAGVSDDKRAWTQLVGNQSTNYLKATGFGFNLHPNARIASIRTAWERSGVNGNWLNDSAVRLIRSSAVETTDRSSTQGWSDSVIYRPDTTVMYGSVTDLWGASWTPADVNNAGFGAALSARSSFSGNTWPQVDSVQMFVCYE